MRVNRAFLRGVLALVLLVGIGRSWGETYQRTHPQSVARAGAG